MAWHGVITNVGKTAIENHLASGVGLNINVVKTGTATVPAANMRTMTNMSAQADTGSIIGKQGTANGAEVQISIQASTTRYVMKEIGLFATMEDESTVLIAYYNDDGIGVEVPAVADFPDFNYVLFCLFDIINSDDLTITMDSTHAVLISQIANNLTTPSDTEGKVLDARQGKVLKDLLGDASSASAVTGNDAFSKIASLNSKVTKANIDYWGAYPNGQQNGYVFVVSPCWNPGLIAPNITDAYVYDSSGGFTDIKQWVTAENVTKCGIRFKISFGSQRVGQLLRISYWI